MAVHNAGALLYCKTRTRLVTNYPIRLSEAKGAAVLAAASALVAVHNIRQE